MFAGGVAAENGDAVLSWCEDDEQVDASCALSVQARWLSHSDANAHSEFVALMEATPLRVFSSSRQSQMMDNGRTRKCSRVRICLRARAISSACELCTRSDIRNAVVVGGRAGKGTLPFLSTALCAPGRPQQPFGGSSRLGAVPSKCLFTPSAFAAAEATADMPRTPRRETF
jgi:hypothetical protein